MVAVLSMFSVVKALFNVQFKKCAMQVRASSMNQRNQLYSSPFVRFVLN